MWVAGEGREEAGRLEGGGRGWLVHPAGSGRLCKIPGRRATHTHARTHARTHAHTHARTHAHTACMHVCV